MSSKVRMNGPGHEMDAETGRFVLSELYNEIRHRRDYQLSLVTRYTGGCAIAVGWVVGVTNPISVPTRWAFAGIVLTVGLMVLYVLEQHGRAYAETAQAIGRVSEALGLYSAGFYPERWHGWGAKISRWHQLGMGILGAATCLFLIVYR
jgi:hypothetical protein